MSRVEKVYAFTDDAECILRLRQSKSDIVVDLSGGRLNPGDMVAEIHLWNEHMPEVTPGQDSLSWGSRALRMFIHSLKLVAIQLREDPRLAEVKAIRGEMIFLGRQDNPARASQMERLGFTVIPHRCKLGAFGEFWENFYSWWVMWAYNPVSTKTRSLTANRRMEMWIDRKSFLERYG